MPKTGWSINQDMTKPEVRCLLSGSLGFGYL